MTLSMLVWPLLALLVLIVAVLSIALGFSGPLVEDDPADRDLPLVRDARRARRRATDRIHSSRKAGR